MATMTATTYSFRNTRPARSIHWKAPRARATNPIPSTYLVQAADVAMRLGLALVPFSAISWTFIAR